MADAEQTLRNLLDKELDKRGYKPRDVKLHAISSEGANYTSKIFLIDVTSPKNEDLKLFAKVAAVNGPIRDTMSADWLFTTERLVYTKIANVFEELQNRHNIPEQERLRFPKFYGCSDEYGKESVILENLVAAGYNSYNRFQPMDWEHASASVKYLAKFHALSFAYAKDNPEEFKELTADMKYEIGAGEVNEEVMKPIWTKIITSALEVVKEDQRDRLLKYFNTMPKMNLYTSAYSSTVLCHGDYRLSNLMFKKTDKLEAIAVDFQTVYAGSPPTDLIYLIFLGSDEKFRAEHYENLIDFYYENLCDMMKKLGVDPTEVYPRETFDSDMKQTMPYAVLIGATILPSVLVEKESAPDLDNFDFNNFVMSPNQLFSERFSGIVNDCIRWNVI